MNPCKTCPFLETSKNFGAPDWAQDVKNCIEKGNLRHTCHCTDPLADGYIGGNKVRLCDGIRMLEINDKNGVRIHKDAFKNFKEFFIAQIKAWERSGLIPKMTRD